MDSVIKEVIVKDIRFPTSLSGDGSDAMVSMCVYFSELDIFLFRLAHGPRLLLCIRHTANPARRACRTRTFVHDRSRHRDRFVIPRRTCTQCTNAGILTVVAAVKTLSYLVEGKTLENITNDFSGFWRSLTSESQIRWIGPEKGAIHLATSAIVNAIW